MNNPTELVTNLIKKGTDRSRIIKLNILYSTAIKGISVLTSFLLVPITLRYLGTEDYGIWLTLSSVISWFAFFDMGIGNGLRNLFSEAVTLKNLKLAKTYVSTAYVGLGIVLILSALLFLLFNYFIDWNTLLNAPASRNYDLNNIAILIFTLFLFRMELKLISIILLADQRAALSNIFEPLANIISLIGIYLLTLSTTGSMESFILVVSLSPVIVFLIATFYFFRKEYHEYSPSFKYFEIKHLRSLVSLSSKFFLIQIAVLVIFSTDNLIITRILGPQEVTIYNIAFKYFNIITMGFAIIIIPFLPAFTEAYVKEDIQWIRNAIKKLLIVWMLIFVTVIAMIFLAKPFYELWVGNKIQIPTLLNVMMAGFILISTWNNIYVYFINSTGKITVQVIGSLFAAIINIPLSIFLARNLNMGSAGVILGTCISLFPGVIIGPLQYYKILNKTAKGLWSR
ncbi:MAG TPA: oligosaccharide flippase family protein [Lentimicrobium sp.]|nr:oligosaccharide flippase family protein [Lentimicrobium sp.]